MSFFGFEKNDLEQEKKRFMEGGLHEDEDIAVYNWGQEDYGGLGTAIQEGNDENNDETFGTTGPVGKDFDFTAQTLPLDERSRQLKLERTEPESSKVNLTDQASHRPTKSRDTIWDSKSSPFSVLPKTLSTSGRGADYVPNAVPLSSTPGPSKFSPFDDSNDAPRTSPSAMQANISNVSKPMSTGVYTLQEIEAEMRARSQQARALQAQAQNIKPPRMRSQSPSISRPESSNFHARGTISDQQILEQLTDAERSEMKMWELEKKFGGSSEQIRERLLWEDLERKAKGPLVPSSFDLLDQQHATDRMILRKRQEMEMEMEMEKERRQALILEEQKRQYMEQVFLQEQQRQQELRNAYLQQQQQNQQQLQQLQNRLTNHRQIPGSTISDVQPVQHQHSLRPRSQMSQHRHDEADAQLQTALQYQYTQQQNQPIYTHSAQPSPQEIRHLQMQQRVLAQLAQAEFTQTMNGGNMSEQGTLRAAAMQKIMEAERLEGKRRRKAEKIAHMSRYNDLMTQSDKDFITRIQVSQLVTSDPYSEDFYAQVYGSLLRSRLGINNQDERVLKFGSGEGVGLGLNQRGAGRRPNAMQRMEVQVERIVNNARQREKEKGLHAIHSLQGALGKTAGRSYKAAPRQMLQVDSAKEVTSPTLSPAQIQLAQEESTESAAGAAKEAAKRGREALGTETQGIVQREPLTKRESLIALESLYDTLLEVEQMRREQPSQEDETAIEEWNTKYSTKVQKLWDELNVMVPLEISNPHPFVSLLIPAKGKKLLPRLSRHLSSAQTLTILTLLVACFQQLDVVVSASVLDTIEESPEKKEVDKQTHLFLVHVMPTALNVINKGALRLISGLLALLLERCDVFLVAKTIPGLTLLTCFLTRVETIKQAIAGSLTDAPELPPNDDMISWQNIYDHLFNILSPYFLSLFPSSRIAASHSEDETGSSTDLLDQPVWQFLAALALHAGTAQQSFLVTTLREKILKNLVNARQARLEDERNAKLANIDLFLHALGLDSNQITL